MDYHTHIPSNTGTEGINPLRSGYIENEPFNCVFYHNTGKYPNWRDNILFPSYNSALCAEDKYFG